MTRCLAAVLAALMLAGCETYVPASPEDVARARYESPEPPSVTLISMVNNRTGRSAHAALLINGSQQVLYDPAGTFTHPELPRRDDIHYGMTPRYVDYYERYHARFSHFVETQKVYVDRATADQVLANAQSEGKTLKMLCAGSVTGALRGVPRSRRCARASCPRRSAPTSRASRGSRTAMSARSTSARTAPGSAPTRCRSSSNSPDVGRKGAGGRAARRCDKVEPGSEQPFALHFLARELARPADGLGPLAGLLDRRLLEMLLELHLAEDAFALKLLLQRPERLIDIVVADQYLHLVSPPSGSLRFDLRQERAI